jgi:hypothetical protein
MSLRALLAGDPGGEAVLAEQHLDVLSSLRQAFWRKAHVLDYERRALGTQFADQSEQSFAYVPPFGRTWIGTGQVNAGFDRRPLEVEAKSESITQAFDP